MACHRSCIMRSNGIFWIMQKHNGWAQPSWVIVLLLSSNIQICKCVKKSRFHIEKKIGSKKEKFFSFIFDRLYTRTPMNDEPVCASLLLILITWHICIWNIFSMACCRAQWLSFLCKNCVSIDSLSFGQKSYLQLCPLFIV